MYYDTESFRDRLVSFNKSKYKTEYRSHLKDVKKSLSRFDSFEAVYNSHNFIFEAEGGNRLIKHECVDTQNRRGSNNGYRVMILCVPEKDNEGKVITPPKGKVYLLDLYPKRGSLQTINLSEERIEELLTGCLKNINDSACEEFAL